MGELDIKEYKSSRSIEQNALLWGIIRQISNETGNDPMDIYISALEDANVYYEWYYGLPDTEQTLKRVFRIVKPMGTCLSPKGKEMIAYKCWVGSSKYDVEEMKHLIEYVMRIASELNIYIER